MIPLLLSCVAPPALAEEPAATPALEKWKVPFESAMHVQFAHATDVVYYVILGDLTIMAEDYFSGAYHFRCDFNNDGALNLTDVQIMADHYGVHCR